MIEYVGGSQDHLAPALLRLSRMPYKDVFRQLDKKEGPNFSGVEVSMLDDDLDSDLALALLDFCAGAPTGSACLSITHTDLGSGTDCEQRLFDLAAERKRRESEKIWAEKVKRDSSKEKDFSAAAEKRRKGEEGINSAVERLATIDAELVELEKQKLKTAWYLLFSQIQGTDFNAIRELDLSNCGLHATGLAFLTSVLLELENRAEGVKVSWLTLDGNELADQGMSVLATFLRLSKSIEGLQVRNVGITEQGVSELVAGLVTNRSLEVLDVRSNGLCALDAAKSAISGVQRFNSHVQILLT
jgi:hypothetical protein